jgi:hypothetical protein
MVHMAEVAAVMVSNQVYVEAIALTYALDAFFLFLGLAGASLPASAPVSLAGGGAESGFSGVRAAGGDTCESCETCAGCGG